MTRILITGINGFAGSHLAEYVIDHQLGEVFGSIRGKNANLDNLESVLGRVTLVQCDITDFHATVQMLSETRPDFIFHLAAQSYVPSSWRAPIETMNTNVMGTLNLFEAIRQLNLDPVIQIAGSSEEYGMVEESELPVKETNQLRPLSPYGVSKAAMDLMGYQFNRSYRMRIIRTRGFNHTGPRRGSVFVTSNWCKQVADIEAGVQEPVILVGNLEARRDFTDVRDMVRGYWLATQKCTPGEVYNICSGQSIRTGEVLEKILARSGVKVEIKNDPSRLRPSDVMILQGDYSKFHAATGWKPLIPFDQTLDELLAYWRSRAK